MIDVKLKKELPELPDMIKRSCLVCGSKDWMKITLLKDMTIHGTSIALCRRCAKELADKINEKTGGIRS